jgi:hypothetical protein
MREFDNWSYKLFNRGSLMMMLLGRVALQNREFGLSFYVYNASVSFKIKNDLKTR